MPPGASVVEVDIIADTRALRTPKLDSAMAYLAHAEKVSVENGKRIARYQRLRLSEDRVQAQITTHAPDMQLVIDLISQVGGEVTGVSNGNTLIQGWLPIKALETIAARFEVQMIRLYFAPTDKSSSLDNGRDEDLLVLEIRRLGDLILTFLE